MTTFLPFRTGLEPLEQRTLLSSAAGTLDPYFGDHGIVNLALPAGQAILHDIQFHPDGRIIAAGVYSTPAGERLILARFLSDGTPDPSFGNDAALPDGIVDTQLPGSAGKLHLVNGGRILFASGSRLVRFYDDGSIDPTFVQDEPSRYKFNFNTYAIDVQSDGSILLSGRYKGTLAKPGHFAVARLNANGTRDSAFGTGGVADFWQHTNSCASDVHAMSDGTIYVAGDINHGYPTDLDEYKREEAIGRRLNSDGTPDLSYGINGIASRVGRFFAGSPMWGAVGSDGTVTIITGGEFNSAYRFTPDGQPDTTFSGDGATLLDVRDVNNLRPAVQSDGAVLCVFRHYNYQTPAIFKLMRIAPTGTLDSSFGAGGMTTLDPPDDSTIFRVARPANDGSIIVAGQSSGNLLLARFWRDDSPAVQLHARNLKEPISGSHRFSVVVRDATGVDPRSLDSSDFRVVLPDGATIRPTLMGIDRRRGPGLIEMNFKFASPDDLWGPDDNGTYTVRMLSNHVFDVDGNSAAGRAIGSFSVRIDSQT